MKYVLSYNNNVYGKVIAVWIEQHPCDTIYLLFSNIYVYIADE